MDTGCPSLPCEQFIVLPGKSSASVFSTTIYARAASGENREWEAIGEFPVPVLSYGAVIYNDFIYVLGGRDANDLAVGTTAVYRSRDGRDWERVSDLPSPTVAPAVGVFDNKIWVVGGLNEDNPGGTSTALTSSDGITWEAVDSVLSLGFGASFLSYNRNGFYLGGSVNGISSSGVIFASSSTGDWQIGLSLPQTVGAPAAIEFKGSIWVVGGAAFPGNISRTVFRFTTGDSTWVSLGDELPEARGEGSLLAHDGRLWYFGGFGESATASNLVWSSSDGTDWRQETPLPDPLAQGKVVKISVP